MMQLLDDNSDADSISLQDENYLTKTFSYNSSCKEYEELTEKSLLDPEGPTAHSWNKVFLAACLISLFIDPLFYYAPYIKKGSCMDISISLEVALSIIRSLVDAFYIVNMYIKFRTAYGAPSSFIFGRGDLVADSLKIASRYLRKDFWLDFVAALPLPQVLIWIAIPNMRRVNFMNLKHFIRLIIVLQFLLRLYLTFQLMSQITHSKGVLVQKAWAGAAFNLTCFMLASHVIGSCWYLLSIQRQEDCWKRVCDLEQPYCNYQFLDCSVENDPNRAAWFDSSDISTFCNLDRDRYPFGIYADAVTSKVTSSTLLRRYLYSLWWGMRQLSSLGQGLVPSTYIGEVTFAVIIVVLGLILFALLIGNMQIYLQASYQRLEAWRAMRVDSGRWMNHRTLSPELQKRVREYEQYRWVSTEGIDENSILNDLPLDLRRNIKRHLYFNLVQRVPLFDQMDDHMLDAICERLKNVQYMQGSCIIQEGDPVYEMLFIIRGYLNSCTTNGGTSGFFNTCSIGPGEFCGEELLTNSVSVSAHPRRILPLSTRTVKATTEVEAVALRAKDLRFIASQFRRLGSKQLRHTFRTCSHQWRTWAACFIQASWLSYKRRRKSAQVRAMESARALAFAVLSPPRLNSKGFGLRASAIYRRYMMERECRSSERRTDARTIRRSLSLNSWMHEE